MFFIIAVKTAIKHIILALMEIHKKWNKIKVNKKPMNRSCYIITVSITVNIGSIYVMVHWSGELYTLIREMASNESSVK